MFLDQLSAVEVSEEPFRLISLRGDTVRNKTTTEDHRVEGYCYKNRRNIQVNSARY